MDVASGFAPSWGHGHQQRRRKSSSFQSIGSQQDEEDRSVKESKLETLSGWTALRCLKGDDFVTKYVEDEWDSRLTNVKRKSTSGVGPTSGPRYMLSNALVGITRASIVVHDPDGLWKLMEPSFLKRLPSVKYPFGGRTLQGLQLELIRPDHKTLNHHISSPLDAYKLPYLHLYIMKCDSMETYKATTKQRLRAWVEDIQNQSNGLDKVEYIIVYVPLLHQPSAGNEADAKQILLSRKIFEKIRTDFNDMKNENCCRISLFRGTPSGSSSSSSSNTPPSSSAKVGDVEGGQQATYAGDGEWGELLNRICKCIVSAFELRYRKFEDQIQKLEGQKEVPGWNYCTYLIVKENLALTWLQIGQYYDALRIYDGLMLEFDALVDPGREAVQATNRLYTDLFQVQILRHRIHEGIAPKGSGSATAASESTSSLKKVPSQAKITGNLSRKLSHSFSFGPKGDIMNTTMRMRADSTVQRLESSGSLLGDSAASMAIPPPSTPRPPAPPSSSENEFKDSSSINEKDKRQQILVPCVFLDVKRKPYRELIYKSACSVVEMRLYLFVRATLLLFAVGRVDEALRRALHFIASFTKDLVVASEAGAGESNKTNDRELDQLETRLISLSWAFCSCMEVVSASHAAIASALEKDTSIDSLLYQSELFAFSGQCFEEMVKLVYPHDNDDTTNANAGGDDSSSNWFSRLPRFVIGSGQSACELVNRELQNWLPIGIHDALMEEDNCRKLVTGIMFCRSEYLRASGRIRSAMHLDIRRAHIHAAHGKYHQALDVLHHLKRKLLSTWPTMMGDVKLLSARSQEQVGLFNELVLSCLETLSLPQMNESQRLEALEILRKTLREQAPKLKRMALSGDRFGLVIGKLCAVSSAAVSTKEDGQTTSVHRAGEVLNGKLALSSSLPGPIVLNRVKLYMRRVESRSPSHHNHRSTSNSPSRNKTSTSSSTNSSMNQLVQYRSTDQIDMSKYDDESMSDHGGRDEEEGPSGSPGQNSDDEEMDEDVSGNGDAETGETQQEDMNHLIFQATEVTIHPGDCTIDVVAMSRSDQEGSFTLDRLVVTIGCLDFSTHFLPEESSSLRVLLVPTPRLFRAEVVNPTQGFIPIDHAIKTEQELTLQMKLFASNIPHYPKLVKLEVDVDPESIEECGKRGKDDSMDVKFRLCTEKASAATFESKELVFQEESREISSKPINVYMKFDATSLGAEVDQIMETNKGRVGILRQKKEMKRSFSSNQNRSINSLNLKLELVVTIEQTDAFGKHVETTLYQTEIVRLRYNTPFQVSQSSKNWENELWHQISVQSNLPYPVRLFDTNLVLCDDVAEQDTPSSRRIVTEGGKPIVVIEPGQSYRLTFCSPLNHPSDEPWVHLKARLQSRYECADVKNGTAGVLERSIAWRQVQVQSCVTVTTSCANREYVRIGSTASFLYKFTRTSRSQIFVKPTFVSTDAKVIDVSGNPMIKRVDSKNGKFVLDNSGEDKLGSVVNNNSRKRLKYVIIFDPNQWMVVGSERGHVDLSSEEGDFVVECECIPLSSGRLAFPVMEVLNTYVIQPALTQYVEVYDEL